MHFSTTAALLAATLARVALGSPAPVPAPAELESLNGKGGIAEEKGEVADSVRAASFPGLDRKQKQKKKRAAAEDKIGCADADASPITTADATALADRFKTDVAEDVYVVQPYDFASLGLYEARVCLYNPNLLSRSVVKGTTISTKILDVLRVCCDASKGASCPGGNMDFTDDEGQGMTLFIQSPNDRC